MNLKAFLILWLFVPPLVSYAAGPVSVALFPFEVNSREDLSHVQKALMDLIPPRVSRGGSITFVSSETVAGVGRGPVRKEQAREAGRSIGADAVIVGTITKLGPKMSLDLEIEPISGDIAPALLSVPVDDESRLIAQIDLLSRQIRANLLRPVSGARLEPRPAGESRTETRPPEIVLKRPPEPAPPTRRVEESPLNTQRPVTGTVRSIRVHKYVRGICFGDLDGDQKPELVVLTDNSVGFYRFVQDGWQVGTEYKAKPGDRFLTVHCGDAEKGGRAKVYVSNYRNGPESFVLELGQGKLQLVQESIPYLLAVVDVPGEGAAVLGQELGPPGPLAGEFQPERYLLDWRDGVLKKVGQVDLPSEVNRIFGISFGDLDGDGKLELIRLSQGGSLYVLPFKGEIQTLMKKNFGSPVMEIDIKKNPRSTKEHISDDRRTVQIPTRIKAIHVPSAGADQLIVPESITPNPLKLKMYKKGRLQGLGWDGKELRVLWSTETYDSAILDFDILERDGSRELVFAVSEGDGTKIIFQPMVDG